MTLFPTMLTPSLPLIFVVVALLLSADGRTLEDFPGGLVTSRDDVIHRHAQTNGNTGETSVSLEDTSQENPTTGLAIDEVIALADLGNERSVAGGFPGESKQELDMWLTREQDLAIHGSNSRRHRRKAHAYLYRRWPGAEVTYRRAPGAFSPRQWQVVLDAMAEWQSLTCLTFREDLTGAHRNYAYFVNDTGCTSHVGMMGWGQQKITLGPGCVHHRVVLHELGHAIGFFHEQSRPDRDAYIRVQKENVWENRRIWFDKRPAILVKNYSVPYDLYSVMHYGQYAFSRNRQKTIITIDPALQEVFGKAYNLSFYDVMLANRMYGCDAGCDPSIICPSDAFRGKDCKCYCRGPCEDVTVQECKVSEGTKAPCTSTTESPATSTTESPATCKDLNRACIAWVSLCLAHPKVKSSCPKSCGSCASVEVTTRRTTTTTSESTTTTFTASPTTTTLTPTVVSCLDQIPTCPFLASPQFNYCLNHPTVKRLCKKSCGICEDRHKTTTKPTITTQTSQKQPQTATVTTESTTNSRPPCKDTKGYSLACANWARVNGLCLNNPKVKELCKYSCGFCNI